MKNIKTSAAAIILVCVMISALPGGYRSNGWQYYSIGAKGCWYTSSEKDDIYLWRRDMQANQGEVERWENNKRLDFSVRCVKD